MDMATIATHDGYISSPRPLVSPISAPLSMPPPPLPPRIIDISRRSSRNRSVLDYDMKFFTGTLSFYLFLSFILFLSFFLSRREGRITITYWRTSRRRRMTKGGGDVGLCGKISPLKNWRFIVESSASRARVVVARKCSNSARKDRRDDFWDDATWTRNMYMRGRGAKQTRQSCIHFAWTSELHHQPSFSILSSRYRRPTDVGTKNPIRTFAERYISSSRSDSDL